MIMPMEGRSCVEAVLSSQCCRCYRRLCWSLMLTTVWPFAAVTWSTQKWRRLQYYLHLKQQPLTAKEEEKSNRHRRRHLLQLHGDDAVLALQQQASLTAHRCGHPAYYSGDNVGILPREVSSLTSRRTSMSSIMRKREPKMSMDLSPVFYMRENVNQK